MFRRRCRERSQTSKTGPCNDSECNSGCVKLENARFGSCQFPICPGPFGICQILYCYCYFNRSESVHPHYFKHVLHFDNSLQKRLIKLLMV
jgi:hypothetical protein